MRHALGQPLHFSRSRVERRYGMTASVGRASHKNAERWRWLLYVALAIVGALLTFVGARAQQKATDEANFRKLIDSFCAADRKSTRLNSSHSSISYAVFCLKKKKKKKN